MKPSLTKKLSILFLLTLVLWVLSSCQMEADRIDTENELPQTGNEQTFTDIFTPTPLPTATPAPVVVTPVPTQQSDFSQWDFSNQGATTPPAMPTWQPQTTQAGQSPFQPGQSVVVTPTPGKIVVATATPRPGQTPKPTPVLSLKFGAKGQEVKQVQQRLKDLRYYSGSVDGTYGSGTQESVRNFQANHGLTADGICGVATKKKLFSSSAKYNKGTPVGSGGSGSSSGSSGSSSSSGYKKPTPRPDSYTSGKTDIYLKLGSSGSNVKYMQNRLIALGYMSGSADGEFAATTETAVIAFQKRHKVFADGVAGPDTLRLMYSNSAKRASTSAVPLSSLREGDEGTAVRSLQSKLKTLGYYTGSVDGSFGAGTTAAVISFQSAVGLKADGVAGKSTLEALYGGASGGGSSSSGSSSSGSSSSSGAPSNYGKTASSNGMSTVTSASGGEKVQQLQSALSSTGFYHGTLDGSYGDVTENAVEKYQQSRGLRVTGMAGPTTQRLLYGGTSESGSYKKLEVGSSGSSVRTLQYALYELMYYDGSITGKYDYSTENAVRAFQQVNGLYEDGIAGEQTQRRLYSSLAKPADF